MLPLVDFVSGWFCIPKHQLQKLLLLSFAHSAFLSLSVSLFVPASSGHGPVLATAGTLTSVQLCGLDAAHLLSLSAFSLLLICYIPFPCSDQSAAVGSPRGWEIPTASSHCMTIHDNTPDLQLSAQRENQDHLVTKLRPARPKTFTLFSSFPLTLSVTCRVMWKRVVNKGRGGGDDWGAMSWQLSVCVCV